MENKEENPGRSHGRRVDNSNNAVLGFYSHDYTMRKAAPDCQDLIGAGARVMAGDFLTSRFFSSFGGVPECTVQSPIATRSA